MKDGMVISLIVPEAGAYLRLAWKEMNAACDVAQRMCGISSASDFHNSLHNCILLDLSTYETDGDRWFVDHMELLVLAAPRE